jgi:hypothetical protein
MRHRYRCCLRNAIRSAPCRAHYQEGLVNSSFVSSAHAGQKARCALNVWMTARKVSTMKHPANRLKTKTDSMSTLHFACNDALIRPSLVLLVELFVYLKQKVTRMMQVPC